MFLAGSSSTFSELYIMPLGFLLLALLLLIHLLMLLMNGTKYKSAANRAGLVPGRLAAAFIVGCIPFQL